MGILLAEGVSGLDSVRSTLVSSFTDVGSQMSSTITDVLPIALGILGSVIVIKFGVKIFNRLTGKA